MGCHIGHLSYAGLGYADDVTLSTPSVSALQSTLNICEEFANEYNVLFNCKKTVCMRVGSGGEAPTRPVTLNSVKLSWHKKVKHLGNLVTHDLKDDDDVNFKRGVFISQVNKLKCKFDTIDSSLRGRLLQTYCCSWYGCQTWDLATGSVNRMNTEWNKAVRRTMNLPYRTRSRLLPLLVNGRSFSVQHRSRVSRFLVSFSESSNVHVAFIGARAKYYSHGALGRNHTRCEDDVAIAGPDTDLLARCHVIRELLGVRDGLLTLAGARPDDIEFTIDYLCCC